MQYGVLQFAHFDVWGSQPELSHFDVWGSQPGVRNLDVWGSQIVLTPLMCGLRNLDVRDSTQDLQL